VRPLIAAGHRSDARELLQDKATQLAADHPHCLDLVEALIEALALDS
jgi:hypothetical protein